MGSVEGMFAFMSIAALSGLTAGASGFLILVMWLFNAKPATKRPAKKFFLFSLGVAVVSTILMFVYGNGV